MKKPFLLLIFVTLVQGCASTPDYQLTDGRTSAIAVADVLTSKCAVLGMDQSLTTTYRITASRLLSVASVRTELYDSTYAKVTAITKSKTEADMKSDCHEFIPKIANMIPEMRGDYDAYIGIISADRRREAEAWSNALEMIANAAASSNQATQGYDYSFIPMPSGRVDLGSRPSSGGGYNHYLVNTPTGQIQCHVSNARYMFCN